MSCRIIFVFVILAVVNVLAQNHCGLYGAPPCEFVPAPPGGTPNCASPGKTYCEFVPQYPKSTIKKLIKKYGVEVSTHLVDETGEEFSAKVHPNVNYGPPAPLPPTYGVPAPPPPAPAIYERPPAASYGVPQPNYGPPNLGPSINRINFKRENEPQIPPIYVPNQNSGFTPISGYTYSKPNNELDPKGPPKRPPTAPTLPLNHNKKQTTKKPFNVDSIHFTTTDKPPNTVFFNEEYRQQNQINNFQVHPTIHSFHPQEQPYFPNSSPAPFSTASYRSNDPYPTLQTITHPPPQFQNNYSYNPSAVTSYNQADYFKRYTRSLPAKTKKDKKSKEQLRHFNETYLAELQHKKETLDSLNLNSSLEESDEDDLIINFGNKTRTKRQTFGRSTLCETTTQFIQPQAALNSKGNWMFVVNQVETARQLVKTETCATTVCSNLCQFPVGYSARCEQKYVQKRLVALDANGQRLYTDTFWFPSCCVCTIASP